MAVSREARDIQTLLEIESIKQLKYRYLRTLDSKQWGEMRELFVEDATSSYGGGKYSYDGRDAIMKFLTESLDRPTILTMHHGHHPEIQLTGDDSAVGTWALEDWVIDLQFQVTIHGAAFYRDEYVRRDGEWRIQSTGYQRTFEEIVPRAQLEGARVTSNLFALS